MPSVIVVWTFTGEICFVQQANATSMTSAGAWGEQEA